MNVKKVPKKKKLKLGLNIVDEKKIREFNQNYFKKKSATDVISFDIKERLPDGSYFLGDIVVCLDEIEKQAKKYHVSKEKELARVVAHGVLHLFGFKDQTREEKRKMRKEEDSLFTPRKDT